ncbi:probable nucleoredoxin 1 [Impatiens glandulifera]|uniref:probable nucleoredoxin 1 n=1 Tax=Impatiens glandulifera TaxID=253017 RepID=UPI001FB0C431|nr:probable nucleoredoxin 1 [Impatiens glandulifera]
MSGDNGGGLQHILSSPHRDYLIRSNGVQVPITSLRGYKVGLYLWASWSRPCRKFTRKLVEAYNDLSSKRDFEIVCISKDIDETLFQTYFSKMPWLAIPFSDSKSHNKLASRFCKRLPHLEILDENGKIISQNAVDMVQEYGAEAYPFTTQRIIQIRDKEEESKTNQSLRSLLVSTSRNFLLSADGKRVCISKLEWKFVGLYFCSSSLSDDNDNCKRFTPKLVKAYDLLKQGGANFEIVTVSLDHPDYKQDDDVDSVNNDDEGKVSDQLKMPWLNIPFKDEKSSARLVRYFKIRFSDLPKLVIIGAYGETLMENAVDAIEEYGAEAFPFTSAKLEGLKEKDKSMLEGLNLDTIFTSSKDKFLIGKVPLYNHLNGKHILLHISGKADTPRQLLGMYCEIKKKRSDKLEIVYIPNEADETTSSLYELPLLMVPVSGNELWIESTRRIFNAKEDFEGKMVVIGPSGKVITRHGRELVMSFGGRGYPFTEERLGEMVKEWPQTMNDVSIHEHEVSFIEIGRYKCALCCEYGLMRAFSCQHDDCHFVTHPKCAEMKKKK